MGTWMEINGTEYELEDDLHTVSQRIEIVMTGGSARVRVKKPGAQHGVDLFLGPNSIRTYGLRERESTVAFATT